MSLPTELYSGHPDCRERGSITAFSVLMLVAVFVLMGMVLDGGSEISAHMSAVNEAEQAARAGAGALSVNALRSDSLQLDDRQAVAAAEDFLSRAKVMAGRLTYSIGDHAIGFSADHVALYEIAISIESAALPGV